MSPALGDIVQRAYRDLTCPAPRTLGVCTDCCMAPERQAEMLATPARDLTPDMIRDWYGAAFGYDLGLSIYLWLMPRVLDLLGRDIDVTPFGNEAAFQRCAQTAPVPDWPGDWPALIADFAAAYVEARLDRRFPDLDVTFCMLSCTGLDLAPALDRLDRADTPRLARAMVRDWNYGPPRIGQNAFWKDHSAARKVQAWFTRPALEDRFLQWAIDNDTGEDFETVLQAADIAGSGTPR